MYFKFRNSVSIRISRMISRLSNLAYHVVNTALIEGCRNRYGEVLEPSTVTIASTSYRYRPERVLFISMLVLILKVQTLIRLPYVKIFLQPLGVRMPQLVT